MSSVDPGEGYRLLVKGEPIREDVSYYAKGKWHKMSTDSNVGEPWNDVDFFPMRVPKEIADNAGVLITTSGPYISIEVHRAALAEIERLKAELEAVKQPQTEPEPGWFDLTPFDRHVLRTPVDHVSKGGRFAEVDGLSGATVWFAKRQGYTQFRCLLKDAPPELVAMTKEPEQPKTETVVFYEFAVKCGHANKNLQLKWRDAKPASNDWIPTGKTETREVVR